MLCVEVIPAIANAAKRSRCFVDSARDDEVKTPAVLVSTKTSWYLLFPHQPNNNLPLSTQ